MTYETLPTRMPTYIAELLVDRFHTRELHSSTDRTQLMIPRTRNKRALRVFSSAAPSIWNALPSDVPECDTLKSFWGRLKAHYFNLRFISESFQNELFPQMILRPCTCIRMIIWDYVRTTNAFYYYY